MAVTNAQRRYVRELHHRKGRRKYSVYLVEGLVNVGEALASAADVLAVYGTPEALATLGCDQRGTETVEVGPAELTRLSTQRSPHGAIATVRTSAGRLESLGGATRVLHLDGLADPGNVGTLVRTAEWFGCDAVTAGPGAAEWYNPKVVAAARGSLFRLRHVTLAAGEASHAFAGRHVVAADLTGVPAGAFEWPREGVLVIGSESHGISAELDRLTPKRVTLPSVAGSRAESLNAAVAGGILLSAWAGANA